MVPPNAKMKRPKWSLTTQFWAAVSIAVVSSALVFLLSKKNIWTELELIVGGLSCLTFIYFFLLFYHGVRFERNEVYSISWKPFDIDKLWWLDGFIDTGGLFTYAGAEAGAMECLIGFLLDIVISSFLIVIIAFLFWLGINILTIGTMVLLLPLFFLFKRSLRVAVARGRACHGNLNKSLMYAIGATIVSMVWLYLIIFIGHHVSLWLKK
jgi:hypothetical protein